MVDDSALLIIQARMSSTRFPGKVLAEVNGKPIVGWQIERILKSHSKLDIVVATSVDKSDDSLVAFLESMDVRVFRGDLENVFSRYIEISKNFSHPTIIRITGDCPLIMPSLIDLMLQDFQNSDLDYLSNTLNPSYPDGLDIEIFKSEAIQKLSKFELTPTELEHVTYGIYKRLNQFKTRNYASQTDYSYLRWTLDYPEDLVFVKKIYSKFYGRETNFTFEEVLSLVDSDPSLESSIPGDRRNEQLAKEGK
jgi:spore coat polysaccharide biosynthesis protein SpsF